MEELAIEGQGAEHHTVHKHPAYKRWCGTFIETWNAFIAEGKMEALEGALELRFRGGL